MFAHHELRRGIFEFEPHYAEQGSYFEGDLVGLDVDVAFDRVHRKKRVFEGVFVPEFFGVGTGSSEVDTLGHEDQEHFPGPVLVRLTVSLEERIEGIEELVDHDLIPRCQPVGLGHASPY